MKKKDVLQVSSCKVRIVNSVRGNKQKGEGLAKQPGVAKIDQMRTRLSLTVNVDIWSDTDRLCQTILKK